VVSTIWTPAGGVPRVSTELKRRDKWGTFKARWSIGRMSYTVEPGLYALGNPNDGSPVLVTANYKMTFDSLRSEVSGLDAWLLVLDTNGINVWCAAGKGTLGTAELVERIKSSGLEQVVAHRKLILPQLAGPGVAAHRVKELSGFRVIFGPVRASDLMEFIRTGNRATPEMRRKTFGLWERTVLIPVELVDALRAAAFLVPVLILLGGIGGSGGFWFNALHQGLFAVTAIILAILAGAVVTPVLLPWLPGRAFSMKGLVPGLSAALAIVAIRGWVAGEWPGLVEICGWFLMLPALASYLAMNFTGASTYTSLSGVKREMRIAVPLQIGGAALGLLLWVGSRLVV